ncbi:MAG: hypothetical protein QOF84_3466 [Streptomyces sp.]|jgi:hypothetical protein|nr:hypothetical protein [Streptomyces sp.]
MTEGPQQPHNPQQGQQGWQTPPAAPQQPQVLRGNVVGEPQQSQAAPSWNAPTDWAAPVPGQGTRGPSAQPAPFAPAEPDWSALAEQSEARARRRKLFFVGGGVLAVVAISGIVATAVVSSNHKKPVASPTVTAATTEALPPQPSFPSVTPAPTYNALDFISTAKKDTAPLSVNTLFPEKKKLSWAQGARTYTKTASAGTSSCTSAASGTLGAVLKKYGCSHLFRVTYVRGTVAVTVGVAVFDDAAHADQVKQHAKGYVLPLAGGGQAAFCHATSCRLTTNAKGRYAYFTIAGLRNNQAVTTSDTLARQAGTDGGAYAFSRIVQRGRDAVASAAASPPST